MEAKILTDKQLKLQNKLIDKTIMFNAFLRVCENNGLEFNAMMGKQEELFYVVARTSGDCWEQITNGINTYEGAVSYKDGAFCKERYPNAFIVATVTVK